MTDEQKAHLRAWVAALRSGEFPQGKHALRMKRIRTVKSLADIAKEADPEAYEYCCLGVACEVYQRATKDVVFPVEYPVDNSYLPLEVMRWLGVEDRNPHLTPPGAKPGTALAALLLSSRSSAASLNDSGMKFAVIADWIEATYLS